MRQITATGTIYGETVTLQQISKPTARKLFIQGHTIYLQSCKYWPFGVWQSAHPIEWDQERTTAGLEDAKQQFDQIVNNYIYYNCDNERGQYPTYYMEVET